MFRTVLIAAVCCLSLLSGCGEKAPDPQTVTVTNTVDVVREVIVTNAVTVAITNVVVEKREPEKILSARKTAPYAVSSAVLDAARLRKLLSDGGARVVDCSNGAVAFVEAREKTISAICAGGVVSAHELSTDEKIAADAGERVRVVPLSSIDVSAVTAAIRSLGGEIVQVVTVGRPVVRAKITHQAIRKLAARGDVRRIERDIE